jgi:hypothetical protein
MTALESATCDYRRRELLLSKENRAINTIGQHNCSQLWNDPRVANIFSAADRSISIGDSSHEPAGGERSAVA